MTAIAARRKRRLIAAVVTSALSAVSLPSGLVLGTNMLLNDSGGQNVKTEDFIRIPNTPVHLVVVVNDRKEVSTLAVLALAPDQKGGTVISVPVGAAADTASDVAPRRIADSYLTSGLDGVRRDVEDLLNISVDSSGVYTESELATAFSNVSNQSVTLPVPIYDTNLDGTEELVIDQGTVEVSSDRIAAGLAATRTGFDELTRFASVKALWTAFSRAGAYVYVDDSISTAPTTTIVDLTPEVVTPTSLNEYVAALLAGRIDVWQFAATRITDAQQNPNAVDMYDLDGGEVLMVMASAAPSALRLISDNLAVMVDVPFNSSEVAQEAVTRLAYAGANVVLVRHVSTTPEERTTAYVNDSIAQAEVESYVGLVGPIEVVETLERIEGVNVRIVLGNDFVAFLGNGGVTATTVAQ